MFQFAHSFNVNKIFHRTSRAVLTRCTTSVTTTPRILTNPAPHVQLVEDSSLPSFLFDRFATFGNKRAIVDGTTDIGYSYAQVQEYSMKIGSALSKLGVKKGDVFAITVSEMTTQLNNSNAQYIITVPLLAENAKETAKQCDIKHVFVIGEAPGCRPLSLLMQDDGKSFPKDVEINPREDVAIIPYSSGTTGTPKGVMLTHFNLTSNLILFEEESGRSLFSSEDTFISPFLFNHLGGLGVFLANALFYGATAVTLPRFEERNFLRLIQHYKVSKAIVAPPTVLFFGKSPLMEEYDLSSLDGVLCGAAPLSLELQTQVEERMRKLASVSYITQAFGMTETSAVVIKTPTNKPKPGSAGTLIAQTEGKVVDLETGDALGANQQGEICIRGPTVMKGYLNNPEATKATITEDGWIHTGDIGYYDSENYFYCVDRLKELIKYKGYQVAPAELEDILISHPKIQDAAVIGIPDQVGNELPKAFVTSTADISKEEIHEFLNKQIAPYKKLRGGIEFVSEIPKSASGKILRRMLRDKER